jgi:NADH dehydrogenase
MRIAIIGGTGFVGSYLTDAFLAAGHNMSLLVREGSETKVRQSAQVHTTSGDILSRKALSSAMDGCSAVIYNVGILRETSRRGITFEATQFEGLVRTVETALEAGVTRLLLMSANGVKSPGTPYQETKYRAEQYALQSGLDVTVLRPSVIFGDPRGTMEFATQLFNEMVRPPIPAVSFFSGRDPEKGAVLMSPVHIEDVASAFVAVLESDRASGKTFALGGPEVLSWKEIIHRIAGSTGKRKWILPMPIWIMRVGATLFDWLPFFPVTRDQLTMLEDGNIADPEILEQLIGRTPKGFTIGNLSYLSR